ncbi:MAG: BREX system serine/threonine kinase PglW [Chromatiaceae bacterium]|nr:BREX system serine/threonine kinase PglW [Chromatiaceae bacterium]MCP5439825.1 BREX system serine/threonine kinase PglW [Chromatiaceae bacterium]
MDKLWKQITPSDFAWEREALEYLKQELPDHEPYRAWANFEFIAQDGSINEVDLLVVTPKGLFLVEIKSHPGEIDGDAGTWVWSYQGRRKAFDNPRLLADRKAKKLASLLRSQRAARNKTIPFISALVFLSAENVVNKLMGPARQQVCTRKNVLDELQRIDEHWTHRKIDRPVSTAIARALEEAGIKESLRARRVGLYELNELLDEADHFQDWRATHSETGTHRRIRIYLTHGKPAEEAEILRQAARLEFRLLEGIEHNGILRAREYQQHDQGPALVFEHDPDAVRLDHFMAGQGEAGRLDMVDALAVMRQLAEAVRFAHGKKLFHRALSPQSIYITANQDGSFTTKIANWATADRSVEAESHHLTVFSHLSCMVQEEAGPYIALEGHSAADADPVYLDVFSLGAIAYLLFSGKPPAQDELELQDKLSRGQGLQITDVLNGAGQDLQDLVQYATHPDVTKRIGSADEFIDYLYQVEDELTRPDNQRQSNPTEAVPGDVFEGGIVVKKRLGRGATSVAFVVQHDGQDRVLKLAATHEQNPRVRAEGETLQKLRHQAIIAHHQTSDFLGHTGLLIDYASEGTLANRLRQQGAVQLELLERFGDDLLGALCHLEEKGISHRDIKPENIGLMKLGQLHLVLFDFSLSGISPDNFTAGTVAYMDPFIRDAGRRRWDDYAERFSAALTLFEMTTGTLPSWSGKEGLPPLIDGALDVDPGIFDPAIREPIAAFFRKALARDVKARFGNAEDMRRGWHQVFLATREALQASTDTHPASACAIEEAQLDTQIGLLPLSPQALDTLSRLNINTVAELIRLPRYELVRMTGVGIQTRRELSDVVARLLARLGTEVEPATAPASSGGQLSVDQLFATVFPKQNDPARAAFLNEYLGRLDGEPPRGLHNIHWPTLVSLAGTIGITTDQARDLQTRVINQWSKNKAVTDLRNTVADLLTDNGGLMTAVELADAVLLRRGSVKPSPERERTAQAIVRAAVETELAKQQRWIIRRVGSRVLIADNTQGRGEELADYAEALGQLADECAEAQPLLSPIRALERVRAVAAPESFAGLSNHRLLRLAVAASQGAALSSRAEFYPRGMPAERAIELAQGALLGTPALTVDEVISRIQGRYPEAQALPGRPMLDTLVQNLELGFVWDGKHERAGQKGAYLLPQAGLSSYASRAETTYYTQHGADDTVVAEEVGAFDRLLRTSMDSARFLALSIRPRLRPRAAEQLQGKFGLEVVSFDQLLIEHLHELCKSMAKPPKWEVVLKADATDASSMHWSRLQMLVKKALPGIAQTILELKKPVLLVDPGLIARYRLVDTWLSELRRQFEMPPEPRALWMLIDNDLTTSAAIIDGVTVPTGQGSGQFATIPSAWLVREQTNKESGSKPNPLPAKTEKFDA